MTGLVLFACLMGLMNGVGFILVWIKMHKPHEDPRLSRGLQLMQTKMSVLEDLSERIDSQASQLLAVLENKRILTDELVKKSNENYARLEELINHGVHALRMFDSQNPIEAMVQEKNVEKLNHARGMIDSGHSSLDVVQKLGISRAEVDFIEQMKRPAPSYETSAARTSGRVGFGTSANTQPPSPPPTRENTLAPSSNHRVEIQRVQFPRITSHI